jgi:RNA polymerase sigma-70 factor (ECF subfamily)
MAPVDPTVGGLSPAPRFDPDSGQWVRALTGSGPQREAALTRLHDLLLRIAGGELRRRAGQLRITGPELDDLAYQAAADALLAIVVKLGQFRGESKFTTWAYKFVIFEVSAKIGRHFWSNPAVPMDAEDWERLPDRFGLDPARETERRELAGEVRRAVDEHLTPRQRQVFVALVLNGVPMDALVTELGTTRNAIYKTMFDARCKLRAALAAKGYLNDQTSRHS